MTSDTFVNFRNKILKHQLVWVQILEYLMTITVQKAWEVAFSNCNRVMTRSIIMSFDWLQQLINQSSVMIHQLSWDPVALPQRDLYISIPINFYVRNCRVFNYLYSYIIQLFKLYQIIVLIKIFKAEIN